MDRGNNGRQEGRARRNEVEEKGRKEGRRTRERVDEVYKSLYYKTLREYFIVGWLELSPGSTHILYIHNMRVSILVEDFDAI